MKSIPLDDLPLKRLLATATVLLGLLSAGDAAGATIVVDTTADTAPNSSSCVLRDALTAANSNQPVKGCAAGEAAVADVVQFGPSVTGTISLQTVLPTLTGVVEIHGPGASQLDLHRATGAPPFRVLTVSGTATISGLTISNGLAQGASLVSIGGGIRSTGALTLDGVVVTGNRAAATVDPGTYSALARGGGIASSGGSLTVIRSKITNNVATAGANGPDQFVRTEAVAAGGGIFAVAPQTSIDRSTISDNEAVATTTGGESDPDSRAATYGGGLATGLSDATDVLTIGRSTISSNITSSSHPGSTYVLRQDEEGGGGVFLGQGGVHTTIDHSTFAGNSAGAGGGILSSYQNVLNATSSTFARNSAATGANVGERENVFPRVVEFDNSIVAEPLGGGLNCASPHLSSTGHNLEGPNPGNSSTSCGFDDETDLPQADPLLSPLSANGGPTETMAPAPNSPAIDQGEGAAATTDQRGEPQPADIASVPTGPFSDGTDIGAFELQPSEALRTVTVLRMGTGGGSVVSTPTGINCGSTCSAPFTYGALVTLSGTPRAGSKAVRWSGCDTVTTTNQCRVRASGARTVTATFDLLSPPNTTITRAKIKSKKRKATFEFASSEAGSTFLCKMDKKESAACNSPKSYKNLKPGKHRFQVASRGATGALDASPATQAFKIKK